MKLGLINSAFAQAGRGTKFGLEKIKEIGFDTVDIFTDPLDIDQAERDLIRTTCADLDLPIKSLCCVAVGLIDFNPSVQRFHLDRCRAFLDLCKEFGSDNLLLVVGEYIWQQQVIPPPRAVEGRCRERAQAGRICRHTRPGDRHRVGTFRTFARQHGGHDAAFPR